MSRSPLFLLLAPLGALAAVALATAGTDHPAQSPSDPLAPVATTPVSAIEHAATVAALRHGSGVRPARPRPVIAVVAANAGTETTDFLVPYGVLHRADVADVIAVGTRVGPVRLWPALRVEAATTTAAFDAAYPEGADYVIVPAMLRADDPDALAWIRTQAARGATIVGICSGVQVVGKAGLLDGHAFTGHWHDVEGLRKAYPTARWVRDRRYVVDRGVATTTGVSASIPLSLALVEAIAGSGRADTLARALGLAAWDESHRSDAFQLGGARVRTFLANRLAVWRHETIGVPVDPGVDEVALALTADAYSRTARSQVVTLAAATGPVVTRGGLRLLPDRVTGPDGRAGGMDVVVEPGAGRGAARALDDALDGVAARYGARTADFVALQVEYARPAAIGPAARTTRGP